MPWPEFRVTLTLFHYVRLRYPWPEAARWRDPRNFRQVKSLEPVCICGGQIFFLSWIKHIHSVVTDE